jgi:hypothetical protein
MMKAKESKEERAEKEFRKTALRLARADLKKAIEWVDADDPGWAVTLMKRAEKLLEAVRVM